MDPAKATGTGSGGGTGELLLATVMFTDVVGFTARTQMDEAGTIQLVRADLREIRRVVETMGGRAIKETGDGVLAIFTSAQRAVECAVAVQSGFSIRAGSGAEKSPLEHRIALHLGEIEVVDGDVYGDEVNVCSRLLAHAKPHGVAMTEQVHSLVKGRLAVAPKRLGRLRLEDVTERVTAYHIWFRPSRQQAAPPAPPASEPVDEVVTDRDWFCPRCDYNLRGRGGEGVCPECGWAFDPALRTVSLLPWSYRQDLGIARALLRTAWLVIRHPARVAREVHRPITVIDAALFFRLVLTLVVVPMGVVFLTTTLWLMAGSSAFRGDLLRFMIGGQVILWVISTALIIIGAIGGTMIFRARTTRARARAGEVSPDVQNRLAALGSYSCAPLLLLPVVLLGGVSINFFAWLMRHQLSAHVVDLIVQYASTATFAAVGLVIVLHIWVVLRLRLLALRDRGGLHLIYPVVVAVLAWVVPSGFIVLLALTVANIKFAPPKPGATRPATGASGGAPPARARARATSGPGSHPAPAP